MNRKKAFDGNRSAVRVMQASHDRIYAGACREAGPVAEGENSGDALLRRRAGRVVGGGEEDRDVYRGGGESCFDQGGFVFENIYEIS